MTQNNSQIKKWMNSLSYWCLYGDVYVTSLTAHPSCMEYSEELAKRARKSPWQCIDCKTCYICDDSGDAVSNIYSLVVYLHLCVHVGDTIMNDEIFLELVKLTGKATTYTQQLHIRCFKNSDLFVSQTSSSVFVFSYSFIIYSKIFVAILKCWICKF